MKKLIALFACVCALCLAVAVQAENAAQQTLADKVATKGVNATRVVQLKVDTASLPVDQASGKAVIVGVIKGNLVLLTSESLAMDIDGLNDEPALVRVYRNNKMVAHASIKKIMADNTPMNHHFYVITLKGAAGMNISAMSIQEAKKLL